MDGAGAGERFPECFEDEAAYELWRAAARRAREAVAPCDDCDDAFRALMTAAGRCRPAWVRDRFAWSEADEARERRDRPEK